MDIDNSIADEDDNIINIDEPIGDESTINRQNILFNEVCYYVIENIVDLNR